MIHNFALPAFITIAFALIAFSGLIWGKSSTVNEYLSNYKKSNAFEISTSLIASLVGGWMFFGLFEIGRNDGIAGIFIGLGYCIGLLILCKYAEKIQEVINASGSHNMIDSIGHFSSKRTHMISSIIAFMFFIGVVCAQFISLRIISDTTQIPGNWSDFVFYMISFFVLFYTTFSGFRGVLLTDKIQLIGILVLFLICISISISISGIDAMNSIPEENLNGTSKGIAFIVVCFTLFPISMFCRADIWQRISSAKDVYTFNISIIAIIAPLLIIYTGFTMFGMMAGSQFSNPIDALLNHSNNLIFSCIVIFSLACALVSTIDTNINVLTGIISNYFYGANASLSKLRFISALIGLMAFVSSIYASSIVEIIISLGAMILIFFPAIRFIIMNSDNVTGVRMREPSIFWSIVSGLIFVIIGLLIVDAQSAFIIGFIGSIIGWYIGKYNK